MTYPTTYHLRLNYLLTIQQSSNVKLFADDTSLFSVTHEINVSARELNDDLRKISNRAFQSKMSFNPDVNKQAQEVIFSSKIKRDIHPPLVFNNNIQHLTLKSI